MANVIDVLHKASGVSRKAIHDIYIEVVENNKRLNGCIGPHNFVDTFDRPFDSTYECSLCKGKLREHDVRWYKLGLEHGLRSDNK